MTTTRRRYSQRAGVLAAVLLIGSCVRSPRPTTAPEAAPGVPAAIEEAPASPAVLPPGEDKQAAILEEALSLYQEAKQARARNDLDAALTSLDDAYGLLLKIEIAPESGFFREKTDLRLLIAQRIQEIYASRRNPVVDNHKSIPLVLNKWVQREIDSFRGPERKAFEEAFRLSGFYRDWIQAELRAAGLPEELVWLAMIESWFMPQALSSARALGMWQFIASTGYRYGLSRDRFWDERMDPVKSTRGAIGYLTDLHLMFGEWTTALAAYNCGEGFVQRCINAQKINYLDNFWDLFERLPFQTARYVPRFIAAVLIVGDPGRFGFALPKPYPALKFETIAINRAVRLDGLAAALGIESGELVFLNPELRSKSTPDREYALRVPIGAGDRTRAAITALPLYLPPVETTVSVHVVRLGETLTAIASKYRTTVAVLQKLNNLKGTTISTGQRLRVPGRG